MYHTTSKTEIRQKSELLFINEDFRLMFTQKVSAASMASKQNASNVLSLLRLQWSEPMR